MTAWSLVYEGFDPAEEGLREALCTLGNGYFCTRGAAPEAVADETHYPGTYLAGGYNRLKTEINGHIIENEDLVNMPNWLPVTFRIDDGEWFRLPSVQLMSYRQELDLRRGILHRAMRFKDEAGRITRYSSRCLVHVRQAHLAALEITLTPENWSGTVDIRSALDGRVTNSGVPRYRDLNGRHLDPMGTAVHGDKVACLRVRTWQSRLQMAQAARTRLFRDGRPVSGEQRSLEGTGYVVRLYRLPLAEKQTVTVEKVVSLFTSRDTAVTECGREACKALDRAGGFESLRASQALAWEHLWDSFEMSFTDRDANRGTEISRILHLHTFHLLQTTSARPENLGLDNGVPSRGWHGEAYRGHILWDELFIFPFLTLREPGITRGLLMYRYRRLDQARAAAAAAGYRGAMYPWQSGSNGREESQSIHLNPRSGRWIPDNSNLQRHVNAAIVYNIYHYVQTTGDLEFMAAYGAEMIVEIARFWADIAEYNEERGRYEIRGVMGPDEYHEAYPDRETPGLDNNAYTNIMAVWVLKRALEVLETLPRYVADNLRETLDVSDEECDRWRDVADKMRVVFHDDGIISQFEGYGQLEEFDWKGYREKYENIQRLDRVLESEGDTPNRYKVSKQADVLMLFYLFTAEELQELFSDLGYPFDDETIPRNIEYYLKRTSHGSTLSWIVHAWVLIRKDRSRSWNFFNKALRADVADVQGGTTPEGIHLGAMAGTVDILQRGYPEIVTRRDCLALNPCLPEDLEQLCFRIRYRGYLLNIRICGGRLIIDTEDSRDHPITVCCGDRKVELDGHAHEEFEIGTS